MKPQLLEVRHQPGLHQVLRDHFGTGREARLHPRLLLQAALDRLLRQQAGADHHAGIRGIRAARNRGDHHVPVVDEMRHGRRRGWVGHGDAALGRHRRLGPDRRRCFGGSLDASLHAAERGQKSALRLLERYTILRPLRAGETRFDRAEVELDHLGVGGIRIPGIPEQPLRTRIRLDQRHLRRLATGEAQVVERHLVDREDRNRGPVLGTHVAERGAIRNGQVGEAGPEELDELSDDAVLAQPFGDHQHQIGRRRALGSGSREPEAQHVGNQHRDRLTEHRGFGFDAAHAPPHHTQPVHHRRVRVGADERVGEADGSVRTVGGHDDAREVFEVDLVNDAGIGRHDAEVLKRVLAPAQECVPFLVPRELELRVQLKRIRQTEVVHLHGMVDDELDGLKRIDACGIAAKTHDAVAHRREIDNRRHAGEILEQDAGRRERNLALDRMRRVPIREGLDVRCLDESAVLLPQQILEEDFHRVPAVGRRPGSRPLRARGD